MKIIVGIILLGFYWFFLWEALINRPSYMRTWNLKSVSMFIVMLICFFFGLGFMFSK